ncbi:MAG: preprotein translocase subunit SecG [Angelakisella sp.]
MNPIEMIGAFIMIIASVLIVGIVAIQDPKGDGISALGGGNSFLNASTDRSIDAKLNKITKVLLIVFFVITVVVYAFAKG